MTSLDSRMLSADSRVVSMDSKKPADGFKRPADGRYDDVRELTTLDVETRSEQSQAGQGKTSSEHSGALVEDRPAKVDFESVLAMEHSGMVGMFQTLENTGLKGFLNATGSVYEAAMAEFFANVKVIAGTIVSFIANRKLALSKEMFAEAFGLPAEGMVGFLDIPKETMIEMRGRFSGSDVPFCAPSKKKEMKMEFRLLHDIVAKALCAKFGSFDMVTSEKFDLMVAIYVSLKSLCIERLPMQIFKLPLRPGKRDPDPTLRQQKQRTQRQKKQKKLSGDKVDSQSGPIPAIPAGGHESIGSEQDDQVVCDDYNDDRQDENLGCDTQTDQEGPDEIVSNIAHGEQEKSTADGITSYEGETIEIEDWVDKDERIKHHESITQTEKETATIEGDIVVRSDPEQTAQQTITYTGQELVNHLKQAGDAKNGEGGQGGRPREGSGRQVEGSSSTRETRSEQSQAGEGKTSSEHSGTLVKDKPTKLLSVLGFDPMSLWGLVVFLVVLFSGNPGYTAGRGFSPAGGAQGGD
ncbi:hypothetical protein F511_35286 [Dorcoceras hygrometricum]|uniref:Uncharacterized protein n=1 Tax=Dorcoceras hygrometricum TaxID=472368 RepID=A0A2Z7CWE5_9LAMI|nr:hypothetical protein F511_35286 [Dorcoceras hygrometricum]